MSKMNLGKAGMKDEPKHTPMSPLQKQKVQNVQPRPKGMGKPEGIREAIDGCCTHSPLKMAGKK